MQSQNSDYQAVPRILSIWGSFDLLNSRARTQPPQRRSKSNKAGHPPEFKWGARYSLNTYIGPKIFLFVGSKNTVLPLELAVTIFTHSE